MIRMSLGSRLSAAVALAAWACLAAPAGANAQTAGKQVLHNATVDQIIEQLSGGRAAAKSRPRYRGLTVEPPSEEKAASTSGCYTGPKTAKSRGLTVVEKTEAPSENADCHPGYISQIHFAFDSARIRPESAAELDKLAQALRSPQLADDKFLVAGHTDARGSESYNQRLSERRALSVVRYLADRGVATDRLEPEGRGESELFDAAHPDAAVNRRVEVINVSR